MLKEIFVAILLASQSFTHAQDLPAIAVLDMEGKGVDAQEASVLTDKLRGELVASQAFNVVERGTMNEILKEQGFQQTGCTSNECIVEAGQLIGVRYMVAATIGKIENTYLLSARIIDVATGKIEKSVQREITGKLTDVLKKGIAQVAKELAEFERHDETVKPNTLDRTARL